MSFHLHIILLKFPFRSPLAARRPIERQSVRTFHPDCVRRWSAHTMRNFNEK